MKHKFVKSHYGSRWVGVVLDTYKHRDGHYSYICLIVKTGSGYTPHKRIIKCYDRGWLRDHESFDISHINPDWFNSPFPKYF